MKRRLNKLGKRPDIFSNYIYLMNKEETITNLEKKK